MAMMGVAVVGPSGRRLGRVVNVLFAPGRNEVVGFVVERPRFLMLLDRTDRFVALDRTKTTEQTVVVQQSLDAWDGLAAKRLGLSWDDTVVWVGMPARSSSGRDLGRVRDGLFDPTTGAIGAIGLSGGMAADIALGVRDIPSRHVVGFDGEAVVFSDETAVLDTSGGVAAAAGKGTAVAKKAVGETADIVTAAAKKTAAYGAATIRVAARSESGRKAVGWLKSVKDEFVDAAKTPKDD